MHLLSHSDFRGIYRVTEERAHYPLYSVNAGEYIHTYRLHLGSQWLLVSRAGDRAFLSAKHSTKEGVYNSDKN